VFGFRYSDLILMLSQKIFVLVLVLGINVVAQEKLDLAGEWKLRLDPEDVGRRDNWPAALATKDIISLPNTTDRAGFGFALDPNAMLHAIPYPMTTRFPGVKEPGRADEHGYLVRRHLFVGPAWYERDILIPASWKDLVAVLCLERAMWKTEVWIDGRWAGAGDSLVTGHRFALGVLAPGRHRLTVRVDNRMIHNISTVTHAYGPETQTRWNGLVGTLVLEGTPQVALQSVDVFSAADRRSARLVVVTTNSSGVSVAARLRAVLLPETGETALAESTRPINCPVGVVTNEITVQTREPAQGWDEFSPVRYRASVALEVSPGRRDEKTAWFGFRAITRVGKEIHVNGRRVFLRGTLDCCVYPKTGHPPMTVGEWEKILRAIKDYGFNHVRFHTWCPPDAAFEAGDRLGLYLQPETPAWVDDWGVGTVTKPKGIGRDASVMEYLRAEMHRIIAAYGNHPSFALLVIGNEFGLANTDWPRVNALVEEIKALDARRLYAGCTARKNLAADDFWITHNSGAATRGVGPAHTDWDFQRAAEASPVPVIAHETGQRPVFPDYEALLPKFTGPLLPLNLERYRRALAAGGLAHQLQDFVRASARFQLTQYKAEHEAMLRTRGYAGYQLLMLNDFTGQSEALVGVLDPFWESKGIVGIAEVRSWNAPTVVLARFPKFVWTSDEVFRAQAEVAHFGAADVAGSDLAWTLAKTDGETIGRGQQTVPLAVAGKVTPLGEITQSLSSLKSATALRLDVKFAGAQNQWNLWVYPARGEEPEPAGFLVVKGLDEESLKTLRRGGKVLLLGHGIKNAHAARTGFESVYWSAGWWGNKFSSLGVRCDPRHPALASFPNDGCSDWQWRDLCQGATTFHLEGAPAGFRPIVQPVPDFHYHALLAHVFEAKVEQGALLVCGYDLTGNLDQRPATRQFRRSLYRYLASPAFQPAQSLPVTLVEKMFAPAGLQRLGARILSVDSEDRANGNIAANAIDGDPATFWHTRWQPKNDPLPHEIVIDLGREMRFAGLTCLPRQDQANGRIAEAEIFCATVPNTWGQPQAQVRWGNTSQLQTVRFNTVVQARYLRVVIKTEVSGQPFAAIAELDVIPAQP
jgi:hypothetical protein